MLKPTRKVTEDGLKVDCFTLETGETIAQVCKYVVPDDIRLKLLQQIEPLENKIKDYRIANPIGNSTGCKIHDLIDPSLNCNWYQNDLILLESINRSRYISTRDPNNQNSQNNQSNSDNNANNSNNSTSQYQTESTNNTNNNTTSNTNPAACWIPSLYDLNNYQFISPIHNLSYLRYGNTLYCTIEQIFRCMLPLFHPFIKQIDKHENINKLQVIVKMQDYQLTVKNTSYTGQVHKEGIDEENIILVGIYYFYVDNNLSGGELQIMNAWKERVIRVRCGGSFDRINKQELKTKSMKTGDCIVFLNKGKMYHKLCRLMVRKTARTKRNENKIFSRKILAFFVIDPEKPIKSSQDITVNWDDVAIYAIKFWIRNFKWDPAVQRRNKIIKTIPNDLINMIIKFVVKTGDERDNIRGERLSYAPELETTTVRHKRVD